MIQDPVFVVIQMIFLAYVGTATAMQTILLWTAAAGMRRHRRSSWHEQNQRLLASSVTPSVSVLAPAYNEARTITQSVRALLTISYPDLEIVVINDGSTDETLAVLREEFGLRRVHPSQDNVVPTELVRALYRSPSYRSLVVIDKVNGGKADALNAGLNVARGELFCAVDADTLIEPDALLKMVRPFLADERTVGAGATIRVVNGSGVRDGRVVAPRIPDRWLPGLQTVEYIRTFMFHRLGWNDLGGNLIISGAFGMFRRDSVLAVGGYDHGTVGEDMELVLRIRRHGVETRGPSRVTFVPDPVAWTEVPERLRSLGRQRERWQRGLAGALRRHRVMMLNPRYRGMGMVAVPYFTFIELVGPALELLGVVSLVMALFMGMANVTYAGTLLLLYYGWGVVLSLAAVLLYQALSDAPYPTGDLPRLVVYALVENLGYRQVTVAFRLQGTARYLSGSTEWGDMPRVGFQPASSRSGT